MQIKHQKCYGVGSDAAHDLPCFFAPLARGVRGLLVGPVFIYKSSLAGDVRHEGKEAGMLDGEG